MEVLFIILYSVVGASTVSASIVVLVKSLIDYTSVTKPRGVYARAERKVLEAEAATASAETVKRKEIPAAIREEIDQTPAWWDSMFHKALHDSGVRVSHDPDFEPEYIEQTSFDGSSVYIEYNAGPRWLEGCVCYACVQAKASVTYKNRGVLTRARNFFVQASRAEIVEKEYEEAYELARTYGIPHDDWEPWEDPAPARPWCG